MVKKKSLNNKGFSLVELIVVIAIMAILVGVLAPNFLRYLETSRVSRDTQLADTVRTAITTAIMDPAVLNATTSGAPAAGGDVSFDTAGDFTGAFGTAIAQSLGFTDVASMVNTAGGINSQLSSNGAEKINARVDANMKVFVDVCEDDGTTVLFTVPANSAAATAAP